MDNQPWSQEAEEALIGSILKDAYNLPDIIDLITSESFYSLQNQLIFRCFETLSEAHKNIDIVTVMDELGDKIDQVGGMGYLAETAHNTPSNRNDIAYAKIVKDKKKERDILSMASEMVSIIHADELSSEENVNNALSVVTNFDHKDEKEKTFKQQLRQVIDDVEHRSQNKGKLSGAATGFKDIDERLNGLQNTDLMILAGRPGSGKSTLAFNIARNISKTDHVVIFSMEMSDSQIVEKMYSSYGVPLKGIRTGQMEDEDWGNFSNAVQRTMQLSLTIDDRGALKPEQIRSKCLRLKRKYGHLGLVVIDYIQLMATNKSTNRTDSVTQITGALKALAKELDSPILALSQLSREVEKRSNKRPILSDLRDSGSIEQDADIIQFIYRDDYYAEMEGRESEAPGIAEINTAKFRGGEVGKDFVKAELPFSRFKDLDYKYEQTEPEPKKKEFGYN